MPGCSIVERFTHGLELEPDHRYHHRPIVLPRHARSRSPNHHPGIGAAEGMFGAVGGWQPPSCTSPMAARRYTSRGRQAPSGGANSQGSRAGTSGADEGGAVGEGGCSSAMNA